MKKSICQSRNVISCYANEIEMKSFNEKMKKKGKPKRGRPNKAFYKIRIRPIWSSEMRSILILKKTWELWHVLEGDFIKFGLIFSHFSWIYLCFQRRREEKVKGKFKKSKLRLRLREEDKPSLDSTCS